MQGKKSKIEKIFLFRSGVHISFIPILQLMLYLGHLL